MLPKTTDNSDFIQIHKKRPSYTYRLDIQKEYLRGTTDGLEAVKQAVYKILNTERYEHVIYSWNYGIELKDLYGRARGYVCSELPRRITEALLQDDRILSVSDFRFSGKGNVIAVSFVLTTIYGKTTGELEVKT